MNLSREDRSPFRRRGSASESADAPLRRLITDLRRHGPLAVQFAHYIASRLDLLTWPDAQELATLAGHAGQPKPDDVERLLARHFAAPSSRRALELETRPAAMSLLFQWHRARTDDGRLRVVKFRHLGLVGRLDQTGERLATLAPLISEVCGAPGEAVVTEFLETLRRTLDLSREAEDLLRLRDEVEGNTSLLVPAVDESLSAEGCLTYSPFAKPWPASGSATPNDKDRERMARRLCRSWLHLVCSGTVFPEEPAGSNLQFLDEGRVALCGGPFHTPPWGTAEHLRSYLAGATVADDERILLSITALCDRSAAIDRRRLKHQQRHSSPFRDARWTHAADTLAGEIFARWHRARNVGLRRGPTLLAFLRGLSSLAAECHRLAPGHNVIRESFQELRLRQLATEIGGLVDAGELLATLRGQADVVTRLPLQLDRILDLVPEEDYGETEHGSRVDRERARSWIVLALLLGVMGALAWLLNTVSQLGAWVEPAGVVTFALLGSLLLRGAVKA